MTLRTLLVGRSTPWALLRAAVLGVVADRRSDGRDAVLADVRVVARMADDYQERPIRRPGVWAER